MNKPKQYLFTARLGWELIKLRWGLRRADKRMAKERKKEARRKAAAQKEREQAGKAINRRLGIK